MHCPPRAVRGCCCRYAASFPPYTADKYPPDEVAQLDISAKWVEPVEVCASPSTEYVHFYSYNERT